MLAWLAVAVPAVRDALIELALDETIASDDVEITTQHGIAEGRLDAFLSSPSLALVVESKLGSSYHDGQLTKYLEWLDKEFAGWRFRGLLTLTATAARWPDVDTEFAAERGIIAQARLWEELHAALAPFRMGERDLGDRNVTRSPQAGRRGSAAGSNDDFGTRHGRDVTGRGGRTATSSSTSYGTTSGTTFGSAVSGYR